MHLTTTNPVLPAAAIVLLLMGCGTTATPVPEPPLSEPSPPMPEDYASGVIDYTVQPGDLLGDIAREFTGDFQSWRAIAEFNGVDDPRTLRQGAALQIPMTLIPGYDPEHPRESLMAARAALRKQHTQADATTPVRAPASSGDASDISLSEQPEQPEVTVGLPSPDTQTTPVKLAAVDYAESVTARAADTEEPAADSRKVKVSGSYYPRGVYAEPRASATLLMRLAPGTVLPLERSIDNWYRVTTANGIGYIRSTDARIIDR